MIAQVSQFIFMFGRLFWTSLISDWGIIGLGIIAIFFLTRVVNFIKKFFK